MKRSPGNISKSDPSTVPAVDLTEVIHWYICMWTFSSLLTPFSHSMLYLCVAGSARLGRAAIPASNDSKGSCLWNYSWLRSTSGRLNIFSPMCDLFTRNLAPRLPSVRRSGERSKTCSRARAPPVRYHNNHHLHLKPPPRYTIVCANRTWYICSTEMKYCLSENFEARVDAAGPSSFPQVVNNESDWQYSIFQTLFNLHAFREDEMIWQDPVDYSHITYEYDHRWLLLEVE